MRLAQAAPSTPKAASIESQPEIADSEDELISSGTPKPRGVARLAKVEVAIPLKYPRRSASSSVAAEDTSADGITGYDTPATSVAVTPADSDIGRSKKRVSASARAQELRSSNMSLGAKAKRGIKRSAATETDDYFTPENADAALARNLQLQEYQQNIPKRRKTSDNSFPEIGGSEDGDSPLSEIDYDELYEEDLENPLPPKKLRASRRSNTKPVIPDSDDFLDEGSEGYIDDHAYRSDSASNMSDSSSAASEEVPLIVQRAERTNNTKTRRLMSRRRLSAGLASALASGMSSRVRHVETTFKKSKLTKVPRLIKSARNLKSNTQLLQPCGMI